MRAVVYLLSLLVAICGAVYFFAHGRPVLAVLAIVPGYLVVAYVLLLVSTFLPGSEQRQFQSARSAQGQGPDHPPGLDLALPPDTPLHPAHLAGLLETQGGGNGFLAWPEGGDLIFRTVDVMPSRWTIGPRLLKGFDIESDSPSLPGHETFIERGGGPVVRLDGGPGAGMVQVWVQPADSAAFAERLRAIGVPELSGGTADEADSPA